MSIDMRQYGQTEFDGNITAIYVKKLRDWLKQKHKPLSDEQIAKWPDKYHTLDDDHIIIVAECNGSSVEGWFNIPKTQGWGKSNLKKFVDMNSLPLIEIPRQLKQWAGKKVKVRLDKNGFMRLAT